MKTNRIWNRAGKMKDNNLTIDEVRQKTVDNSLIIGSVLGTLSYIFSLIRFFKTGFNISFIIEFLIVVCFIVITTYRSKLNLITKTYVFICLLGLLALSDAITYGLFSAAKVYFILIPFYAILILSLRRTLILFSIAMLCFFLVGYLHHAGLLSIPRTHDPAKHIIRIYPWINHGISIIVVAIMILMVTYRYLLTFSGLISDLETSNEIITESERNYREIFNSSSDAIFIHDLNGAIIDVNDSMLQMYNYRKEEIENKTIADFSSNEAPYTIEGTIQRFKKAGLGLNQVFDWYARKKNGELFWVEVVLKKISIGGTDRVLAFVRDVNEKKQTAIQLENYKNKLEILVKDRTEELETTNKELIATNKELFQQRDELKTTLNRLQNAQKQLVQSEKMASLGVLSAGIAHEINNPLNHIYGGIMGLEDYFRENLKDHGEILIPLLESIRNGASRAADIVKSLNHYSRHDETRLTRCDIHTIIDNCLMILNNQINHRIEIEKQFTGNPHEIYCREGKMHQALFNIILNAVQAIEKKGTISLKTRMENQQLTVSIEDTGCGINPENLPKITDPFFTTKDPGKGTGLGLSISYNIIREHNGTMSFESQPGKGTRVILMLPVNGVESAG